MGAVGPDGGVSELGGPGWSRVVPGARRVIPSLRARLRGDLGPGFVDRAREFFDRRPPAGPRTGAPVNDPPARRAPAASGRVSW